MKRILIFSSVLAIFGSIAFVIAQPPPPRTHDIIEKGTLTPLPATQSPPSDNEVSITIDGDDRVIVSNGIPNHKTGQFPNRGNPNRISVQRHEYRVPAKPEMADRISPMHGEFGVAVNGIPFDPGAGEFYQGEPGWQYEPLSGAIDLGIDVSHAHVQPTGKYHYHGLPTGLIDSVNVRAGSHSPLVGWAADGFPMYAVYGYSDPKDANSPVQKLTSSYQLKQGDRPGGNAPSGTYDGTFVRDYEYVEGSGDLDECNGRFTITPEYPEGTYAYFMTEAWPVVPRNYRGTPSDDFRHGPGPGASGGRGGPGRQMTGGPAGQHGLGNGRGPGRRGDQGGRSEHGGRGEQGMHGGPGGQRLGRGGPPRPGQVLPEFVQQELNLTKEQAEKIAALQALVDKRLKEILTEQQHEQLQNHGPPGGDRGPDQFRGPAGDGPQGSRPPRDQRDRGDRPSGRPE